MRSCLPKYGEQPMRAALRKKNYTWKKNNHSCDGATRSWIICSPAGRWTISSKIQIRCVTSGKGFSRCGQRGWLKQSITWLIKRKREKWTSIKPIHLRVSPWLRTLEVTMKIPRSKKVVCPSRITATVVEPLLLSGRFTDVITCPAVSCMLNWRVNSALYSIVSPYT